MRRVECSGCRSRSIRLAGYRGNITAACLAHCLLPAAKTDALLGFTPREGENEGAEPTPVFAA